MRTLVRRRLLFGWISLSVYFLFILLASNVKGNCLSKYLKDDNQPAQDNNEKAIGFNFKDKLASLPEPRPREGSKKDSTSSGRYYHGGA